ncbi:MAG: GNAT family N-acetyltransferase [Ignavibacteriaceae bacterium]
MIEIKKLSAKRWRDLRDLRLEALLNSPTAFGSSAEEEKLFKANEWKKRINNSIFATFNDKPVGIAVFIINEKIKTKHIANIYGIFVKKEFRGKGIGKKLINGTLKIISQNKSVSKIKLAVNPEQNAAVDLYKQFGFKVAGKLKNELRIDGKFYDELIMEKII